MDKIKEVKKCILKVRVTERIAEGGENCKEKKKTEKWIRCYKIKKKGCIIGTEHFYTWGR